MKKAGNTPRCPRLVPAPAASVVRVTVRLGGMLVRFTGMLMGRCRVGLGCLMVAFCMMFRRLAVVLGSRLMVTRRLVMRSTRPPCPAIVGVLLSVSTGLEGNHCPPQVSSQDVVVAKRPPPVTRRRSRGCSDL